MLANPVYYHIYLVWFWFFRIYLNRSLIIFEIFRVIGLVVLTLGVYAVLWGKHVDDNGDEIPRENNVLEAVKCCSGNNGLSIMPTIDEIDEDVETGNVQTVEKEGSLVVVVFCRESVDNVSRC